MGTVRQSTDWQQQETVLWLAGQREGRVSSAQGSLGGMRTRTGDAAAARRLEAEKEKYPGLSFPPSLHCLSLAEPAGSQLPGEPPAIWGFAEQGKGMG